MDPENRGKWVEAIQVLELAGSTMAMKMDDNDWYCQMEPSSVTQLAPCANIPTASFAMLVDDSASACKLTQHVNRLSHMLLQCDEANISLVDWVLRGIVRDIEEIANESELLDNVGFLFVALHQASRISRFFGNSLDLKDEIEEILDSRPFFRSLAQALAASPDLRAHCQAVGHIWESPNASLILYGLFGLVLVDFEHNILHHIQQQDVEVITIPGQNLPHLKIFAPNSKHRDTFTFTLSEQQWYWWTDQSD